VFYLDVFLIPRLTAQGFYLLPAEWRGPIFLKRKNRRKTLFLVQSPNIQVGVIIEREDLPSSALFEGIANDTRLSRILVVNKLAWQRLYRSAIGGGI